MRGGLLHSWLGDRLLDKALWRGTTESLARAWLIGFPVTIIPFLPVQSLIAAAIALFFRANLLVCIGLQFLSTPLTAPVHLPLCYVIGKVVLRESIRGSWEDLRANPWSLASGDNLRALYIGALVLGFTLGVAGYFITLKLGAMREARLALARSARKAQSGGG